MKINNKYNKVSKQILKTLVILLFWEALGTFSKYLDYRQAQLPYLLHIMDERLDFHNFLGSFAPWILIAVCISVKSASPVRAAVNVFAFFYRNGILLLFIHKFHSRIFPKKLRHDLVRTYNGVAIYGVFLLVCKRKWESGSYFLSRNIGGAV